MLLRRQLPLAAAAALALACAPSVPSSPAPASITYAVFDITSAVPQIPLPNDLALQASSIATFPDSAQKDLLNAWAMNGGFPNDQEVDLTVDFQTQNIDPDTGAITNGPADLDLTTITTSNLKIIELPGSAVSYNPISAADYVKKSDRGTLTIRNLQGGLVGAPWVAGVHYAIALRGGANGIKTKDGVGINPSPIFYLLTRGVNLSLPQNETLLPGTRDQKAAAGAQLEQLRQSYLEPFTQVSSYFPSTDLAVMGTFQIAPNGSAYVQTDPNRGLIPLPSDFLLDATGSLVQNVPAFGPLAAGIATLDGFSTTGMMLSTTSAPILASTVNKNTVFVYDLTNPNAPVRVPDATEAGGVYQSEPSAIEETLSVGGHQVPVSTAIGLQPAIPVATAQGVATLPPLKENTEYAVLISNGVKDLNQAGLSRSTLAQLLLFTPDHPVAASGASLVQGVPDDQATLVESIRQKLHPAIAQLLTDKSIPRNELSMAYTFRTQSISGAGNFYDSLSGATNPRPAGLLEFAALPYASSALSTAIIESAALKHTYTAAQAFTKYGIDTSVPSSHIAEVIDATVITPELLSNTTGAFDPALAANPNIRTIPALIAVPNPASVPACPTALAPFTGARCAPMVVFHHGLGSDRAAMLAVADSLTAQGFVVAAIDGAKHGARSWCTADNQCDAGGTCVAIAGAAGQGDAVTPGICSTRPAVIPELCSSLACVQAWGTWTATHGDDPADGHALISGQDFVSANFFRTRDTIRQDVIDQSALILALSPPPSLVTALGISSSGMAIPTSIATNTGIVIDPRYIYWEGQSLGAILGTLNAAANPRISHVALNVGGGTLVDILTNAPAFSSSIGGLLSSVGITPGTSAYLQFLILAKWILDPADPINMAGHLKGDAAHPMLPDLLTTEATHTLTFQSPKNVLGQMAECDETVPNPFNLLLYGDIGLDLANLSLPQNEQHPSNLSLFGNAVSAATGGTCPGAADGLPVPAAGNEATLPHAFITTWGISESFNPGTGAFSFSTDSNVAQLTGAAQGLAAAFLADPASNLSPPYVVLPQ